MKMVSLSEANDALIKRAGFTDASDIDVARSMLNDYSKRGYVVKVAGKFAQMFVNLMDPETCKSYTNGTEYMFENLLNDKRPEAAIKRAIKALKIQPKTYETNAPTDLDSFIFDQKQLVEKRVFTSHLLNDETFAFGIRLARPEDLRDKSTGNVIGQEQVWRPVVITSEGKGWPVSKWKETEFKISYESIPEEMSLRWGLDSIDDFRHGRAAIIDGLELFNEIRAQYEYYNYYRESMWYAVNALWDTGTYCHQLFSAYPLKEERGMSGTGKTKTMGVSCRLTLNATDIMTNPSESTLFRETESLRPTKYIDEAEKLFKITKMGPESDNRVELINASYSRNGVVPRQEKQKNVFITKWYHVYSPTVISSIMGLFGATESRAITQVHTKALNNDQRGERDPEDDAKDPKWQQIRNKLYLWTLQNWSKVLDGYEQFSVETDLRSRDLQLWKPLIVIAKVIDEKELMPKIIKFAEKLASQRKIESMSEGSLDYQLFSSLSKLLPAQNNKVYVEAIRYELDRQYPLDLAGTPRKKGYNKTISTHLDRLGLAELKGKDRTGAYYELDSTLFGELAGEINADFSSQSSHSSHPEIKQVKIGDESVTNVTNTESSDSSHSSDVMNPKIVIPRRPGDECDANDAFSGKDKGWNNLLTGLEKGLILGPDFEHAPGQFRDQLRAMAKIGSIYQPRSGVWMRVNAQEEI